MVEYVEKHKIINLLTALENEFQQFKPFKGFEHAMYRKLCETEIAIGKLPAADVVPVVRCKDCKYRTEERRGLVRCRAFNYMPMCVDNFCSYGERRDGDTDNGV